MSGAKIVIGERLSDRIPRELPTDPEKAISSPDLCKRLGGIHPNKVSHICSSLRRAKVIDCRYVRIGTSTYAYWWRVV